VRGLRRAAAAAGAPKYRVYVSMPGLIFFSPLRVLVIGRFIQLAARCPSSVRSSLGARC
jgi:hypothetical protein